MNSIVLVCSVLASLAIGVLVAYAVCTAMFGIFRIHSRQVMLHREQVSRPVVSATQS